MHKIKEELSGYCQQILMLLDIFYFKNLELRERDLASKLHKNLQKMYKDFLIEQNTKFQAYELQ